MLFVIDVGNSHTVTGLYDHDHLIDQWRLKSDGASTDDELAIQFRSLFSMAGINYLDINGIILASVVPTLETAWIACCEKYFSAGLQQPLMVVSDQNVTDLITVKLPNPSEVGADRLVNGIAAFEKFPGDLVVIDFGTAITFDCITYRCEYLGGAILPGIAISLQALADRTAKLPHIDVSAPPTQVIGSSTIEAMKSGVLHGYGAMIDGLVGKISIELQQDTERPLHVLATGGMAQLIAPYTTVIDHVDPLLTLDGLKIIYQKKTGL